MKKLLRGLILLSVVLFGVFGGESFAPAKTQAATPDGVWTWRNGTAGHTKWDVYYPYYQIEIAATTFYTQCTTIQYCDSAGCAVINTTVNGNGHWQNYPPYGTEKGSHYFHTGAPFYVLNWLDGADVENYYNYKAFCAEYTPTTTLAKDVSAPAPPHSDFLPPLPSTLSAASSNSGAWYYGQVADYRYDYGYPYIQVVMATPNDYFSCTSLQFWRKAGYWEVIPIGTGHWQTYSPWGGFGWSRRYHLKGTWYTDRYTAQENVRNAAYYVAWCVPF